MRYFMRGFRYVLAWMQSQSSRYVTKGVSVRSDAEATAADWQAIGDEMWSVLEDLEPCEHGCHFQRPYGLVVMAGCPIHD